MRRLLLISALALVMLAAPPVVRGDETSSEDPVTSALEELVREVRALRESMQTTNIASIRARLALERLAIQQDLVSDTRRRLDGLGDSIAAIDQELSRIAAFRDSVDEQLEGEYDPDRRDQLEKEMNMITQRSDELESRKESLEQERARVSTRLAEEQEEVDVIRDEVRSLERELQRLMEQE